MREMKTEGEWGEWEWKVNTGESMNRAVVLGKYVFVQCFWKKMEAVMEGK